MGILLPKLGGISMDYVYFTHFITIIMTDSEQIASFFFIKYEDSSKVLNAKALRLGGGGGPT